MIDSTNIPKIIKSKSTGNNDSMAQALSENTFPKIRGGITPVFSYSYPEYTIEGATYNYYVQNIGAIMQKADDDYKYSIAFSTDPSVSNISSLSGLTQVKHELYRIEWDYYKEALQDIGSSAYTDYIVQSLKNPLITFVESATGSTGVAALIAGNRYTFTFPNLVKPPGGYTIQLFQDRAQYFINTKFVFPKKINQTLGDIEVLETSNDGLVERKQIIPYYQDNYVIVESSLGSHSITGETIFSGLTVNGAFLTFFLTPQKPDLYVSDGNKQINVIGNQPTYSPTFNFSRVDDGDFYRLQVTYDKTDTAFSGPTKIERLINKQDGDAEYVRTYSAPLLPNKEFLYRIGNTKQIISLFGTKQQVTSWTDPIYAVTANDGKFNFTGTTYLNSVDPGNILSGVTIELIGIYSNSSIDLFVDTKNDKSIFQTVNERIDNSSTFGSSILTTSDVNGYFDFGRIEGGTFSLRITPPPELSNELPITIRQVSINSDLGMDIVLAMIWGSESIIFSDPYVFF